MTLASYSCLLRMPPFRRGLPVIAVPAIGETATAKAVAEITQRIITDRTGGNFWALSPSHVKPVLICGGYGMDGASMRVLARLLERLVTVFPARDLLLVAPGAYGPAARVARKHGVLHLHTPVDPHGLLDHAQEIHELGRGDIGDLAALRGLKVTRYASPDHGHRVEGTQVARQLIQDWHYRDPYTGKATTILKVLEFQALWRRIIDANQNIGVCFGMSLWKRRRIAAFFTTPPTHPPFFRQVGPAVKRCATQGRALVTWATRMPPTLAPQAQAAKVPVWRVEDGFVRSVGLGSGLQVPASIFVDQRGIYYDPSEPSDLEHILATVTFDSHLRERARLLIDHVVCKGISKYGRSEQGQVSEWGMPGQRVLLVPGQVSDDLSVVKGGGPVRGNLELLRAVHRCNPDAFIIYRPHPDVVAGHRQGRLPDKAVMAYADHISIGGSITDIMGQVDEIHTLTSLAGFEGLMRQRKVVTYGCPFYAGWGLTTDLGQVPTNRRQRTLLLEDLVAGALILYPRYIDPLTQLPCEVETVIERFNDMRLWRPTLLMRIKQLQGKIKHMMAH
ncbi:capsule polysaccharide export protein [Komagataeibacter diospyri]|uniref:Capsule polysaccharide export protein n=1 Tax=Komagataeibacter diospyri TaxID=1932662 RepID=A0A4P5NUB8_9PROT|nr:capsule polysaccharide export protein [Komagataeibacter diospyri]